jgi:hypothetical protein
MNRKLAVKVQLLCLALLLGAALACGGSDETAVPTQAPATAATDTPAPPAEAAVKVLEATFSKAVDEDGEPVDPTDDFAPDEKIYLTITFEGRPEGIVTGEFYRDDEFLGQADVDLSDLESGVIFSIGGNTYVNFWMDATPDDPSFISDDYRIDVSYEGEFVDSYSFRVVSPSDAIPSQIREVTLARGADSDYNPVNPTTTFALDEEVYIVGRGDIGLYTRLEVEWYVDGQLDEAGGNSITAHENATDTGFYFYYVPDDGWPEGEHQVVLTMDGQEVGRYDFTAEESDMISYEDPNGVFSLQHPADFEKSEDEAEEGYRANFLAPDKSSAIYIYFDTLDAPFTDEQWQGFASEYGMAGRPGFGEDTVELDRQLGEAESHFLYMEGESEETGLHGLVWIEESEGAVVVMTLAALIDQWPDRQAQLSAALESFIWSPDAVYAVIGGE